MKKILLLPLFLCVLIFGQTALSDIIALVNDGKLNEAESKIDAFLKENKEDPGALFVKGLILMKKEKDKEAIDYIENAISLNPKEAEYYKLAGLLYEKLDNKKKAVAAWKNCIKYAKENKLKDEAKNHLEMLESD